MRELDYDILETHPALAGFPTIQMKQLKKHNLALVIFN
jgi:hypothetical protein